MNGNECGASGRDLFLENFGAELTEAAYPVMLRHGQVDNWELDLWNALKDVVNKWDHEWPSAGVILVDSPSSPADPKTASV